MAECIDDTGALIDVLPIDCPDGLIHTARPYTRRRNCSTPASAPSIASLNTGAPRWASPLRCSSKSKSRRCPVLADALLWWIGLAVLLAVAGLGWLWWEITAHGDEWGEP